eukprot:1093971-Pleurochrysis_carterae.AAC.1
MHYQHRHRARQCSHKGLAESLASPDARFPPTRWYSRRLYQEQDTWGSKEGSTRLPAATLPFDSLVGNPYDANTTSDT